MPVLMSWGSNSEYPHVCRSHQKASPLVNLSIPYLRFCSFLRMYFSSSLGEKVYRRRWEETFRCLFGEPALNVLVVVLICFVLFYIPVVFPCQPAVSIVVGLMGK